jgi:hypothetical protein
MQQQLYRRLRLVLYLAQNKDGYLWLLTKVEGKSIAQTERRGRELNSDGTTEPYYKMLAG